MIPFRDDQCPERSAGLSHFAEAPDYICADCNTQCVIEDVVVELEDGSSLEVVIGERECTVDHGSLMPSRHDASQGTRWSHCGFCDVQIEQGYPQHGPQGPSWGKGRTGSSRAQKDWMNKLEYMRWYYANKVKP